MVSTYNIYSITDSFFCVFIKNVFDVFYCHYYDHFLRYYYHYCYLQFHFYYYFFIFSIFFNILFSFYLFLGQRKKRDRDRDREKSVNSIALNGFPIIPKFPKLIIGGSSNIINGINGNCTSVPAAATEPAVRYVVHFLNN